MHRVDQGQVVLAALADPARMGLADPVQSRLVPVRVEDTKGVQ